MSDNDNNKQHASLLARVNFPIYCVRSLTERHIIIGGGGGMAKTGISNPFEIYELQYDPITNTARATLATHFDVGSNAIMNMCIIPKTKYSYELASGGMQGMCHIYDVRFRFKNGLTTTTTTPSPIDNRRLSNESSTIRRRHMSLSSQNSIDDDIEENNFENKIDDDVIDNDDQKKNLIDENIENDTNTNHTNTANNQIPDYQFDFELKKQFQTDFHSNEPYQKLIKYSSKSNKLITAGADGHITLWLLPQYEKLQRIKGHDNEIDDMDLTNEKCHIEHLCTISRDEKCLIWNIRDDNNYKLLDNLQYQQFIPILNVQQNQQQNVTVVKYVPRLCRYSIVEGNENHLCLFIAINNRSKLDNYLLKWSLQINQHQKYDDCKYKFNKIISTGNVPTFAMSINDDGRFLAIGKQNGDINVYITFSLQCCYYFKQAHNIFVTGIEFLPTLLSTENQQRTSLELVGGSNVVDAAFISISVDNRIVLHKINKRATLDFIHSFIFFILFILFIYVIMNYFDL